MALLITLVISSGAAVLPSVAVDPSVFLSLRHEELQLNISNLNGPVLKAIAKHTGESCWKECDNKTGACDWCGPDMGCCRSGWQDDPAECRNALHFLTESHECVDIREKQLLQEGDDCWFSCGKAGQCHSCKTAGVGEACCRRGWGADPLECTRAFSFTTDHHECVGLAEKGSEQAAAIKREHLIDKLKPFGMFIMFGVLFWGMIMTQSYLECQQMDKLGIEDEVLGGEFGTEWYHRMKKDVGTDGKAAAPVQQRVRQSGPWQFSAGYSMKDICDPETRQEYLKEYITWESKFIRGPGVNATGLTNDGMNPDGGERNWSAPSKEAIHLCCLARRLSMPSPLCEHLMPMAEALEVLHKKVKAYERFKQLYPRFHGFLPWFLSDKIDPTDDWKFRIPCLDNGQFAWALYETIHACEDAGHTALAERFRVIFKEMCDYAVHCGYYGAGQISRECVMSDRNKPRPRGHDPMPWDQEPFSYFVDLFGNWKKAGYSRDERDRLWQNSDRIRAIAKVPLKTRAGNIDVLKGWHFSSHELWKYLQLPLRNIQCSKNVLMQCERARTTWAAENNVPGLWASCSSPTGSYVETGIAEGVSMLAKSNYDLLTPYGAFPTILADEQTGTAFLKTMLDGPNMQGEHGSMESIWLDGSACCEVLTWDAKITTVLAILGGGDHLERYLRKDGLWDRFESITKKLYEPTFGADLAGSHLPFRMPTATL